VEGAGGEKGGIEKSKTLEGGIWVNNKLRVRRGRRRGRVKGPLKEGGGLYYGKMGRWGVRGGSIGLLAT